MVNGNYRKILIVMAICIASFAFSSWAISGEQPQMSFNHNEISDRVSCYGGYGQQWCNEGRNWWYNDGDDWYMHDGYRWNWNDGSRWWGLYGRNWMYNDGMNWWEYNQGNYWLYNGGLWRNYGHRYPW